MKSASSSAAFSRWICWFSLSECYDPNTFEAVQLEDGSTAYIHRPVIVPPGSTILEVQAETGLEELAGEEEDDAFVETINALKQYTSKVRTQCFFPGLGVVVHMWPEVEVSSLH